MQELDIKAKWFYRVKTMLSVTISKLTATKGNNSSTQSMLVYKQENKTLRQNVKTKGHRINLAKCSIILRNIKFNLYYVKVKLL